MPPKNSAGQPSSVTWVWEVPSGPENNSEDRADRVILNALEQGAGNTEQGVLPSVSRNQLKKLIDEGHVTTQGKAIKANRPLKPGMQIKIEFPPPMPSELIPEDLPLTILYEDEHLAIINKPQNLTVHPSPTQMEGTLVHGLLHRMRDLSGIGGVLRPGIVHRIDKNTSGALVITKTDAAHQRLSETFSKHDIERSYWALCYGCPPHPAKQTHPKKDGPPFSRIESMIGRNPADRKKMSMKVTSGKQAVTHYRVLKEYSSTARAPFASWLEVTLETGRTHQIRVHLTGIGHSLLGDPVYGTPSLKQPKWTAIPREIQTLIQQLPGQALHARVLGFQHPITGKPIRVEAEPPLIFKTLTKSLEKYGSKDARK